MTINRLTHGEREGNRLSNKDLQWLTSGIDIPRVGPIVGARSPRDQTGFLQNLHYLAK